MLVDFHHLYKSARASHATTSRSIRSTPIHRHHLNVCTSESGFIFFIFRAWSSFGFYFVKAKLRRQKTHKKGMCVHGGGANERSERASSSPPHHPLTAAAYVVCMRPLCNRCATAIGERRLDEWRILKLHRVTQCRAIDVGPLQMLKKAATSSASIVRARATNALCCSCTADDDDDDEYDLLLLCCVLLLFPLKI